MKYEFKVVDIHWGHDDEPADLQARLNELGSQGWQLGGTLRDEHDGDDHDTETTLLLFQRPVG